MISQNLFIVTSCIAIGATLKKIARFPNQTPSALNAFVIWVSLPALILKEIPNALESAVWNLELLVPVSMAWILFALSVYTFSSLQRMNGWPTQTVGAVTLTAGLGNTSFVGFPLIESLHGKAGLPTAMLCDQLGSFLVLATVGILYASKRSPNPNAKAAVGFQSALKKVLLFPPFLAILFSFAAWRLELRLIGPVPNLLDRLASTLLPLALIAVGFQLPLSRAQLSHSNLSKHRQALVYGLLFKLALAPLIFILLYRVAFGSQSFATQITILESAMAPMITAGVVAEEFGFDQELTSLMIGFGIPLSLITVPLWNTILTTVGFTA